MEKVKGTKSMTKTNNSWNLYRHFYMFGAKIAKWFAFQLEKQNNNIPPQCTLNFLVFYFRFSVNFAIVNIMCVDVFRNFLLFSICFE